MSVVQSVVFITHINHMAQTDAMNQTILNGKYQMIGREEKVYLFIFFSIPKKNDTVRNIFYNHNE